MLYNAQMQQIHDNQVKRQRDKLEEQMRLDKEEQYMDMAAQKRDK